MGAVTGDFEVDAVRVMLSSLVFGLSHGRVQRNLLVTPDVFAGLEALGDSEFDDTAVLAEFIKGPVTGRGVADIGSISNAGTRMEKTGARNDVELLLRQIGIFEIAITFGERVNNRSMMTLGPGSESSGNGRSGLDLESVFIRLSTLVADHIAGSIVSEIDKLIVWSIYFVHATGHAIWVIGRVEALAPCNCQLDEDSSVSFVCLLRYCTYVLPSACNCLI